MGRPPGTNSGMQTSSGTSVAAGAVRLGGGTNVGTGDGHGACASADASVRADIMPIVAATHAHLSENSNRVARRREEPEAFSISLSVYCRVGSKMALEDYPFRVEELTAVGEFVQV